MRPRKKVRTMEATRDQGKPPAPNGLVAPQLDQIAVARFRQWRSSGRVNLVYTIEVERVGAFDWNRDAVPIKRDPL